MVYFFLWMSLCLLFSFNMCMVPQTLGVIPIPSVISYGVPQGSVFGHILIALYMLPYEHIISKCKSISCHCYTDDIQLFVRHF